MPFHLENRCRWILHLACKMTVLRVGYGWRLASPTDLQLLGRYDISIYLSIDLFFMIYIQAPLHSVRTQTHMSSLIVQLSHDQLWHWAAVQMRLNLRVWMLCQNLPLQRFACISGGGGGGTKVGVERRKSYYNLCPVLSDSEPFLWYIIAPESSILVFLWS